MVDIVQEIAAQKIIAIVRDVAPANVEATARALLEGGIRCVEITFDLRDPRSYIDTQRSIALLCERVEGLLVGAGTVTTPALVHQAVDAGARYILSPDMNPQVIDATCQRGVTSIPGCMTPTEALRAQEAGAHIIKLFPAGALGQGYVKALCGPLRHLRFVAVGGVTAANLPDFLRAGCIGAGVGGNLVEAKAIAAGNFARITALAREFAASAGIE